MSDAIDDGRTDDNPIDEGPIDEDREISDVGRPHAGDDVRTDGAGSAVGERDVDLDGRPQADRAALDEAFPPAEGRS
jgi:hypothetical protein